MTGQRVVTRVLWRLRQRRDERRAQRRRRVGDRVFAAGRRVDIAPMPRRTGSRWGAS